MLLLNFAIKRRKDAIRCWAVSSAQFNVTPGPARGHNNLLAFENQNNLSALFVKFNTDVRCEYTLGLHEKFHEIVKQQPTLNTS